MTAKCTNFHLHIVQYYSILFYDLSNILMRKLFKCTLVALAPIKGCFLHSSECSLLTKLCT